MDARIVDLVQRPAESLATELKRWIDPDSPQGAAKIVKAVLALRNHGGGYLAIGFDDKTLSPTKVDQPREPRAVFHPDKIQALISKFASDPFEVQVEFVERDQTQFPVIAVPVGVKTPVAVKAHLSNGTERLLAIDDVYVRSLNANNKPSTTKVGWRDWAALVEVCFDNREADVARFLRRHFGNVAGSDIVRTFATVREPNTTALLDTFRSRFQAQVDQRGVVLPKHGALESALQIAGQLPKHAPDRAFLNLMESSNPNLTGWPMWLVSNGFQDKDERPYVLDGGWEEFLFEIGKGWDHLDFIRFEPAGSFYHYRAFQDDIGGSGRTPKPGTALDFGLAVIRPAEAIAAGMAFARALGCDSETTKLRFTFRWSGLAGRVLSSWASPGRYISGERTARQDELVTTTTVALSAPLSAITANVMEAVQPVFNLFDGFSLSDKVFEDLVTKLLERRL